VLSHFTDEQVDSWVSIIFDAWINVRNRHLINVIGVSTSGAVFLLVHDSSSITASVQNILDFSLKTINDVGPYDVIQVITNNATNCEGAGKINEWAHPNIFWSWCLVHTLNLLMHDIFKHRDCRWINDVYKRGKKLIKFVTKHTRFHFVYGIHCNYLRLKRLDLVAIPHLQVLFEGKTGFRCYGDEGDDLITDRDGANAMMETVRDGHFWSQVRYFLQFSKPIYNIIQFVHLDRLVIGSSERCELV